MAIPTFEKFIHPTLLRLSEQEGQAKARDIETKVAQDLNVSVEEKGILLKSGTQTRFMNRLIWATIYLEKSGLIQRVQRGLYQVTKAGSDALALGQQIDLKFLEKYPSFLEFQNKSKTKDRLDKDEKLLASTTYNFDIPEEIISDAMFRMNAVLEDEVLALLKQMDPKRFEQIVIELMESMDYGVGEVTRYAGDGGVDGIISEDELGLDKIYLQAKRYSDGRVNEKEMRDFVGALATNNVSKGVFITTSMFSDKAKESAHNARNHVVRLVDGHKLTKLMIKHNLGVRLKKGYEIKEVDSSFFED